MKFKSLSPRIVLPATIAFLIWSRPALAQDSSPKPAGNQAGTRPWMNQKLSPDDRADMVLREMTLDEKIELMHGNGMDNWGRPMPNAMRSNGGAGFVFGIPRLGLPMIQMSDAAYGVHGGSLYGCGENRDRRLLREYGDERPSSAHETGAVQGHLARLRQRVRLHFLARPSRSIDRARVSNSLWARGILVACRFGSRAVDQTRSLPPNCQPHRRLISRSTARAYAFGSRSGASSATVNTRFPRLKLVPCWRSFSCRRVSPRAPPRLPLFSPLARLRRRPRTRNLRPNRRRSAAPLNPPRQ